MRLGGEEGGGGLDQRIKLSNLAPVDLADSLSFHFHRTGKSGSCFPAHPGVMNRASSLLGQEPKTGAHCACQNSAVGNRPSRTLSRQTFTNEKSYSHRSHSGCMGHRSHRSRHVYSTCESGIHTRLS